MEQFSGPGNISISVSPPEQRSSFQHRSSSLVGDANESVMDNGRLYLGEQLNRSRMSKEEASFEESSRFSQNKAMLTTASLQSPFGENCNETSNLSEQVYFTIFLDCLSPKKAADCSQYFLFDWKEIALNILQTNTNSFHIIHHNTFCFFK